MTQLELNKKGEKKEFETEETKVMFRFFFGRWLVLSFFADGHELRQWTFYVLILRTLSTIFKSTDAGHSTRTRKTK